MKASPESTESLGRRARRLLLRQSIRAVRNLNSTTAQWLGGLRWMRLRHLLLQPRPGDIYIATAPKAGTTWVQQIAYQLVTGGRGEFDHILQVSPFLDQLGDKPEAERLLASLPSPRILKTHLDHDALKPPPDSRVLYVTRGAADTLLSLHHHECLYTGFHVDLEEFVETMAGANPWFKHLESWWPRRNDPNVLHVRYEDLIADLEGGIRRIARFLDIPIEDDRLADILEKCGFDYMKRNNARFDFRLAFHDAASPRSGFIHKGRVGSARAALSPEQQERLQSRVADVCRRLGIPDAGP